MNTLEDTLFKALFFVPYLLFSLFFVSIAFHPFLFAVGEGVESKLALEALLPNACGRVWKGYPALIFFAVSVVVLAIEYRFLGAVFWRLVLAAAFLLPLATIHFTFAIWLSAIKFTPEHLAFGSWYQTIAWFYPIAGAVILSVLFWQVGRFLTREKIEVWPYVIGTVWVWLNVAIWASLILFTACQI